jgi:NADPH:quinone reductase-like Zn-dependent oxidoreductase
MRLGGEAAGVIVAVGEGVDAALLNKKISFHKQGCWTQYTQLDGKNPLFIVLHDSQDLKKAAAAYINPITAVGQLEIIEGKEAKWFVADAAASSLNKMLIKLARTKGFESICVVRREEQAMMLKEEYGVKHVFL